MNDLILDYTSKQKLSVLHKRILLVFGILLIVADLVVLIVELADNLTLNLLLVVIANISIGIILILQSLEHKILYPRMFIHIRTGGIAFRLGRFRKENLIDWGQVSNIKSTPKAIEFILEDRVVSLRMIHFPSSDEKRIRGTVDLMAKSKNINCT